MKVYKLLISLFSVTVLGETASADPVEVPASAWEQLAQDLRNFDSPSIQTYQVPNGVANDEAYPAGMAKATVQKTAPLFTSADSPRSIGTIDAGTTVDVIKKSDDRYSVKYRGFEGWVEANTIAGVDVSGLAQTTISKLIKEVAKLQAKYQSNPYFLISGFSAELSLPPSVSINFNIREAE